MAQKKLSLDSLVADPPPKAAPELGGTVEKHAPKKPEYRANKRAFTAWARNDAYDQLKMLAIIRKTTVQALLEEGMDMVFEKYGYDQIAKKQ